MDEKILKELKAMRKILKEIAKTLDNMYNERRP